MVVTLKADSRSDACDDDVHGNDKVHNDGHSDINPSNRNHEVSTTMELLNPNYKSYASNSKEIMSKKNCNLIENSKGKSPRKINKYKRMQEKYQKIMNSLEGCKQKSVLVRRVLYYSSTKRGKSHDANE